jgi:hypothetical protein
MPQEPARAADRQIARFDDGDLWRDGDADPPESPAGWYFRPRGGAAVWVGPYPTAEAAASAPHRGDPLAAARRRLEDWRRSRRNIPREASPPPPRPRPRPAPPRIAAAPEPPPPEPEQPRQLALGLVAPVADAPVPDARPRPRRRRAEASAKPVQVSLFPDDPVPPPAGDP